MKMQSLRSAVGTCLIMLVAAVALAPAAWAGDHARLPVGVPDVLSMEAQEQWEMLGGGTVGGDANYPMMMFVNKRGDQPGAILLAFDAQNAAASDQSVILVALFADPRTVTRVYYDEGSAHSARPSGAYTVVEHPDLASLPQLLKAVAAGRLSASTEAAPAQEEDQEPTAE